MRWVVGTLLFFQQWILLGQGQLIFNNRVNNVLVAPIFGLEPSGVSKQGNGPEGFPAGGQNYQGAPLSGAGYTAQLFGGSTQAPLALLQALLPQTSFRSGDAAGFIVAPNFSLTVPGVGEGESAKVILRAWDNQGGSVTNWVQVIGDPSIPRGESFPIVTPPLGSAFRPPPNLVGLQSFNLATGLVNQAAQLLRINFQPPGIPPFANLLDRGLPYGQREGGLTYGWGEDMQEAARARAAMHSPDQRHDTFIEMNAPGAIWELALTNGIYGVHLAAGDPETLAGVYRIEVEGAPALNGTPSLGQFWVEADAVVAVNDGRLTIRNGDGAFSNRLAFVEVFPVRTPLLQAPAPPETNEPFQITFEGDGAAPYYLESSIDLIQWVAKGPAMEIANGKFSFEEQDWLMDPQKFFRARVAATGSPVLLFSSDFEESVGSQWSANKRGAAPGGRHFLGLFGATNLTLTLTNLPAHARLLLVFDLFVTGSWEGNGSLSGPDRWQLRVVEGTTLLSTTFRTVSGETQAYPGAAPIGSFPPNTGATERNTLGFGTDAVYRMSCLFDHSQENVMFEFAAFTTETVGDEGWGLDNVGVSYVPSPF